MTDNEIIKALECHKDETNSCQECAYDGGRGCSLRLAADVLDLINSLKAEIKRLKNECFCLANERDAYKDVLDTAVTEAVKEFAERLNKEAENVCIDREGDFVETDDKIYDTVANWCRATSDNLLKEMVGEKDES